MASTQTPRRTRQSAARTRPGQSLALIGLVLFVLFAITGLAVDGGNAYQNQRSLDQAASAASLAGMNYVAEQKSNKTTLTDNDVKAVIGQALLVNNVPDAQFVNSTTQLQPGQVGVLAKYMDKNGNWLKDVGSLGNIAPPKDTWYISVQLRTPVETYFARMVGTTQLNVSAFATAGICPPVENVYPLGIDTNKVPLTTATGTTINLTRSNSAATGDFNWLRWNPGTNETVLKAALTKPGTLSDGFSEATPGAGSQNGAHAGTLEVNDWVWGYPSTPSATNISSQISALESLNAIILPVFDSSAGASPNISYHINRLGLFQLANVNWQSSSTTVGLKYLGEATGDVCQASPPVTVGNPSAASATYTIIGHVDEIPVKKKTVSSVGPVDVQIVQDISGSMLFGWNCGSYGCASKPNRRVDGTLPALRSFVNGLYANNADSTASNVDIALVTFGMQKDSTTWDAKTKQSFVDYTQKDKLTGPQGTGALNPSESTGDLFPQEGYGTPTARGVNLGVNNLKSRATQRNDSAGNKRTVKKVLLLVSDGMANMTADGKDNCDDTTYSVPADCADNTNWQSTMYKGTYDPPNSPIGKTVALMDDAKANGIEVFLIGAALQTDTPHSLKFDLMASDPLSTHLYDARSSSDMSTMVKNIKDLIFSTCQAVEDAKRNAAGAEVILHDANTGDVVKTTTTDANGNYSFSNVEAGRNYTIEERHLHVTGSDGISRNYDFMYVTASQTGPIPLYIDPALPGKVKADDVTLRINQNEAENICPTP
jgi:Flp pilus assembly protein TadG